MHKLILLPAWESATVWCWLTDLYKDVDVHGIRVNFPQWGSTCSDSCKVPRLHEVAWLVQGRRQNLKEKLVFWTDAFLHYSQQGEQTVTKHSGYSTVWWTLISCNVNWLMCEWQTFITPVQILRGTFWFVSISQKDLHGLCAAELWRKLSVWRNMTDMMCCWAVSHNGPIHVARRLFSVDGGARDLRWQRRATSTLVCWQVTTAL